MVERRNLRHDRSHSLFQEAQQLLPGGVDSPVRAFAAVGGEPLFIARGKGSRIFDADGNEFIDYVGSWGPLILGHAHPKIVAALQEAAERGTSFGATTELETTLAKLIVSAFPAMAMVRFVNSGTEAVMSALRLARAFNKRDIILKFAGCYHGHADGLLVQSGSGLATLGIPSSPGVPASYAEKTLVCPYNDLPAVEQTFKKHQGQIAAVIVEPVAGNMGVVPPRPGFLQGLRRITREDGALLVFDEVITGFRVCYGGMQTLEGLSPDLTCLGKIIGGGLPVGAYGGKKEIMGMIAPLGPVYQAGTLSGNPLAMTAGIETLKVLGQPGVYERLDELALSLARGLEEAARQNSVPVQISRVASMLTLFFTSSPVEDYESARRASTQHYKQYFWHMMERGVYLPPSQFEAQFVSLAHSPQDIEATVEAAEQAFSLLG